MRLRMALSLVLLIPAFAPLTAAPPDAAGLAAVIDRRLEEGWRRAKVKPAPMADDAEFLRRLFLDLTGRIPTSADVRAYLADRSVEKRARMVERLLASPGHVRHAANVWRARWLPQSESSPSFDAWLRQRVRENAPLDRMVRELLRSAANRSPRDAGVPPSPEAFLAAVGREPEERAGVTARLFLGVNVDCAQCHDHPFARWTKQQFWEFAALFSVSDGPRLSLPIPGLGRTATARFLNGDEPVLPPTLPPEGGRAVLATWLTSPDNPYFARNEVNRTWARFFGVGLVEPLDDLSGAVPPSHSELLDELARAFAASGFDHQYLVRAIVHSRAYRLASADRAASAGEERLFRRMALRPLTGEQLYDSLLLATGLPEDAASRAELLARFNRTDPGGEGQRTVPQALLMMNGDAVARATRPGSGLLLDGVIESPFLDTAGQVEALFLAVLGRSPREDERRRFVAHVESRTKKALADVLWALLNSNEFGVNH